MCLLVLKPAGKSIPLNFLKNADARNPHGCGVAIAKNNKIRIEKSSRWSYDEVNKVLESNVDSPAIVHFRYATKGSKNFENTHPFSLGEKWAAAHNGTIPSMETEADESDTRAFLRQHVIPLLDVGARLDDKDILGMLGKSMGLSNKMTFLSADGSYGIANESSGHWRDGVWYSNNSYEDFTPIHSRVWTPSQARYQGGWDQDSEDAYFRRSRSVRDRAPFPTEEEEDDYGEAWHTFNVNYLYCDNCNQRVIDEFRIENRSGLCYCHRCYDQI